MIVYSERDLGLISTEILDISWSNMNDSSKANTSRHFEQRRLGAVNSELFLAPFGMYNQHDNSHGIVTCDVI